MMNLDEIPSSLIGIDASFKDIYKNKRERSKGKLGGNDPYFDSSDLDNDISEDRNNQIYPIARAIIDK